MRMRMNGYLGLFLFYLYIIHATARNCIYVVDLPVVYLLPILRSIENKINKPIYYLFCIGFVCHGIVLYRHDAQSKNRSIFIIIELD